MRTLPYAALALLLLGSALAWAQKEKREPLNEAQIEQIREAGIDPDARIGLYARFLCEKTDAIKATVSRKASPARTERLDNELQDFTALIDELGSNLDMYAERHADLRKSLKALAEAAPRWIAQLKALPGEGGIELTRKEAIEAAEETAQDSARLLREQTDYFNQHKDEQGQDRAEPK